MNACNEPCHSIFHHDYRVGSTDRAAHIYTTYTHTCRTCARRTSVAAHVSSFGSRNRIRTCFYRFSFHSQYFSFWYFFFLLFFCCCYLAVPKHLNSLNLSLNVWYFCLAANGATAPPQNALHHTSYHTYMDSTWTSIDNDADEWKKRRKKKYEQQHVIQLAPIFNSNHFRFNFWLHI